VHLCPNFVAAKRARLFSSESASRKLPSAMRAITASAPDSICKFSSARFLAGAGISAKVSARKWKC